MNRRTLLKSIVSAFVAAAIGCNLTSADTFQAPAPAIVLYGDGEHDDTDALEAWDQMLPVVWPDGSPVGASLHAKHFKIREDFSGLHIDCEGYPRQREGFSITKCWFDYILISTPQRSRMISGAAPVEARFNTPPAYIFRFSS